ncbi:cation:proton antiporter [Castellaniella caeni]|uniref:cation:proton antiporter n=1 Tax=Castellaniella caeni TaxID=266123 RepID=UPI0009FD33E8|nr:cation:proton antiporter [Castellaniella caeni]
MKIGLLVFGLSGLLALISFMPPLAGRLRLPYSVLLAIVGFVLGVIIHVHGWAPGVVADFLDSLQHFDISSETFLFVFLPVLLFETALATNIRRLLDDISPILVMAIVAVVVCTVAVGFSLAAISPYGLVVCLMLGAIVATTDPVAVVGIFQEVGAPRRLSTLVEGEALFNDAASIALYSVLLSMLFTGDELSVTEVARSFLVSFLGGGLAGYAMGWIATALFRWLRGWPAAEVTLTVAVAYLTFFVAEHYLGVSGVVATVIAGLVVGSTGRTRMSPTTFEQLEGAWSQFGFWANSLIFLFAAMLIPRMMAEITWMEVLLILVVFIVTLIARAVIVYGLLPLLGRLHLSTRVSRSYRAVMLLGGLRGAVSLALALAVTEQPAVPHEARQFIAVATTGFVLMTLFINGLSLRPLIARLGLNQLSAVDRTLRDQAQVVELEALRLRIDEIARNEHIGQEVLDRLNAVFDASQTSIDTAQVHQLTQEQKVAVGMGILAGREEEMFFETLKAQVVDWRTAESLLARAERLEDAVRAGGIEGFESAIEGDLRYSNSMRLALRLHHLTGRPFWLGRELAQRFTNLMCKWAVARRLIRFARTDVQPLLGAEVTDLIVAAHQRRLTLLESALQAMALQYPSYALHLQEAYLARMARSMERMRYRDMLTQNLISGETYSDLIQQVDMRWGPLEKHGALDITMTAATLVPRVSLFEGLDEVTMAAICRVLKPRLVVPGQDIPTQVGRSRAMYFVASGAVVLDLPDGTTAELGSGQIFGEMALVMNHDFQARARSLGYSRLLMLQEKDFKKLLDKFPELREKIDTVVRQRLRAVEVWQQFESGERQHEPLPRLDHLLASVDALAQHAEAVSAAGASAGMVTHAPEAAPAEDVRPAAT